MCPETRQNPYLEVIAILWFVWMTDTIRMAGRSVRVQRGPLLRIDGVGTLNVWPFALFHELRKGTGRRRCERSENRVGGVWTRVDSDRAELQILPKSDIIPAGSVGPRCRVRHQQSHVRPAHPFSMTSRVGIEMHMTYT